ncbi:AhpC/TSA family protein [Cellulophaga sp. 20_2_10]|uniref:peroxiredoxin-like family protein n=1 Tax=Cellulophaga sp. 20_2_10 TaxID=2942476 RepID=UPI00201A6D36|nr:peroxiredoxin-like family protein [Cellulophaga sp. 20_2_10]MCL5246147.1 AhpC/TSA family protein [Cellulophaga sp. 20_2_10]
MTLKEQTEELRQNVLERMPKSIVQTFKKDISDLVASKLKENALQVGATLPDSVFKDITGKNVYLSEIHTDDYLILNFYRGGWCPYCNMELREYNRLENEFKKYNAHIVAISAEMPEFLEETNSKNNINYPILSDINAEFMKKLGIVFSISEKAKIDFTGFGVDFKEIHGNTKHELPVPAIYVIDKNFKVVFTHFEEDYMTRLEPTELLEKFTNNKI